MGKSGRRAFTLAKKLNYIKGLGGSYNYFGKSHYFRQNFDDALIYFKKADEYFKKCGFLKGSASVLNNCGVIYNSRGDYEMALVFQKKALEMNILAKNEEGIGNNYANIGNTLNLKGEYLPAMEWLIKAEKIFSKLEKWEPLATVYYNMGFVNYNLHQPDKAIKYCELALKLVKKKVLIKLEWPTAMFFSRLIYSDPGKTNYTKANYHLNKVIQLCKETGDKTTLALMYLILPKAIWVNENWTLL